MTHKETINKYMKEQLKKDLSKKSITIIPHKNSCGKPEMANGKTDVIEICCGDDLGGNNNEFYQCPECRDKDFKEYWINEGYQLAQKETAEKVEELRKERCCCPEGTAWVCAECKAINKIFKETK